MSCPKLAVLTEIAKTGSECFFVFFCNIFVLFWIKTICKVSGVDAMSKKLDQVIQE